MAPSIVGLHFSDEDLAVMIVQEFLKADTYLVDTVCVSAISGMRKEEMGDVVSPPDPTPIYKSNTLNLYYHEKE